MSDNRTMLCETADGLFADAVKLPFAQGWAAIGEAGFATLLIPEADGGFGGDMGDLLAVVRLAGIHALALPVGETVIAAGLIARDGLAVPDGPLSFAARAEGRADDGNFTGTLHRVPWGGDVAQVIAVIDGMLFLLNTGDAEVERGHNPAGEPRDTLTFRDAAAASVPSTASLDALGALLRVGQIAGALDAALALSIDHANQRQQFGKPLSKFQAVQQNLAILAVEAAAVNSAGAAAAAVIDAGTTDDSGAFEIAAAKLRANMAAGTGSAIAHQVHGAIGFTAEYPLHRLTRRMMGWRSEFGNDRYWAEKLGSIAVRAGGAGLWEQITARSDID